MLTNQNLENSKVQTKKVQKTQRMHNFTPLSPYDTNMQIPLVKRLGKYQFSIDQKLGSGMAGDVYIAVDTETGELACVKVIDRQLFKTQHQKIMLQQQIKCQKLIQCENTIKILQVFDNNSFCFIVTQFCQGGDLYRFLRYSENGLSEELVQHFGYQIGKVLLKMKQNKIIHRDIKPENILLRNNTAKLGDFGFAVQQKNLQLKQQLNIGSPLYMSLQALQNNKYSYASDIFSYGIVLYQMIHKISPWQCNDQNQLKQRMRSQEVKFKQGLSESVKDLIKKCLERKLEDRIEIQAVLEHEFFKAVLEAERLQNQQKQAKTADNTAIEV